MHSLDDDIRSKEQGFTVGAADDRGIVSDPDFSRRRLRHRAAQPFDDVEFSGGHDATVTSPAMQGVVKSYDPGTGTGVVVSESDRAEYDLAQNALEGSIFRMLRQGQRVVFDLDGQGRATGLHMGSEVDLGTPGPPPGVA